VPCLVLRIDSLSCMFMMTISTKQVRRLFGMILLLWPVCLFWVLILLYLLTTFFYSSLSDVITFVPISFPHQYRIFPLFFSPLRQANLRIIHSHKISWMVSLALHTCFRSTSCIVFPLICVCTSTAAAGHQLHPRGSA